MLDPLFKGMTRSAKYFGIPIKPFIYSFFPIGLLAMYISVLMWVLVIPVYILLRLLVAVDDKFFTEAFVQLNFFHKTTGATKSIYQNSSDK
jgi:type IV secretory pathway VirB3-like protein